jgi:hypothetical protein
MGLEQDARARLHARTAPAFANQRFPCSPIFLAQFHPILRLPHFTLHSLFRMRIQNMEQAVNSA